MTTGDVIRKYRKIKGLTQEEMAGRLGVTAPAVNKWERGNTLPDVALLGPIARLLGISTDELLCFREELTEGEIGRYLEEVRRELECGDFREVFCSVKKKIEEYPNCERLIWQAAVVLDARRTELGLPEGDGYGDVILGWYERCLGSEDEWIRNQAADSLFYACFRRGEYERAARYLEFLSRENPERKRREAMVNSRTGRRAEAYRACEELVFTGYQQLQTVLKDLRILYREDGDRDMVRKLTEVSAGAARTFEMGRYDQVSVGLDAAVWERDVDRTAQIMGDILDSVGTIGDCARSNIYQHMVMRPAEPEALEGLRRKLLEAMGDERFAYMRGNEAWERMRDGTEK